MRNVLFLGQERQFNVEGTKGFFNLPLKETESRYYGAYLVNQFTNHAIPGAVMELLSIFSIRRLIDLILEAQILGKGIQDINGEALITFWLPKDILSHHNKRFFLRTKQD